MRFLFFTILLISISHTGHAQSTGFRKPLLWYTIYDPSAGFIGLEDPVFTVYGSGQVIYWRVQHFHMVSLDTSELAELLSKLSLSDTFFVRSRRIWASGATDQPDYDFRTNLDTLKFFCVYGSMRNTKVVANVPAPLKAVYDFITNFNDERSVNWLPDKIEVLLSDYDHCPGKPINWPVGWPNLKSADTRIRQGGASFYLNARDFPHFLRLLNVRKENQAFLINGCKIIVCYRKLFRVLSVRQGRRIAALGVHICIYFKTHSFDSLWKKPEMI